MQCSGLFAMRSLTDGQSRTARLFQRKTPVALPAQEAQPERAVSFTDSDTGIYEEMEF